VLRERDNLFRGAGGVGSSVLKIIFSLKKIIFDRKVLFFSYISEWLNSLPDINNFIKYRAMWVGNVAHIMVKDALNS